MRSSGVTIPRCVKWARLHVRQEDILNIIHVDLIGVCVELPHSVGAIPCEALSIDLRAPPGGREELPASHHLEKDVGQISLLPRLVELECPIRRRFLEEVGRRYLGAVLEISCSQTGVEVQTRLHVSIGDSHAHKRKVILPSSEAVSELVTNNTGTTTVILMSFKNSGAVLAAWHDGSGSGHGTNLIGGFVDVPDHACPGVKA
jgi:hypothetical protein